MLSVLNLSLSSGLDQPWEFAGVVIEPGEHGFQIRDPNVLREDFAEHGTKIRGEREVAPFVELMIVQLGTVLTTGPNYLVGDLHDRMPVIVPQEQYDLWLDPDVTDFEAIRDTLKPYDANLMRRYPASMKLNNSRIDDAESASPVTLDTPTQAKLF